MRIGLDFDNTIACYEGVFHAAAVEKGLIPPETGRDKTSVRDYLRAIGREDDWTELQGYIYGARMDLVAPYPGTARFIRATRRGGHDVFVISHKTIHPFRGPDYDLHGAARRFLLEQALVGSGTSMLSEEDVWFETTLADKFARIAALRCDVFIDDLPEFLSDPSFPAGCRPILFDPHEVYPGNQWGGRSLEKQKTWDEILEAIFNPGVGNGGIA